MGKETPSLSENGMRKDVTICVWQRMKENPGGVRRGPYTLCSIWTSSCRRYGSSEGFEQGNAQAGLSFSCTNLPIVHTHSRRTRLEISQPILENPVLMWELGGS